MCYTMYPTPRMLTSIFQLTSACIILVRLLSNFSCNDEVKLKLHLSTVYGIGSGKRAPLKELKFLRLEGKTETTNY